MTRYHNEPRKAKLAAGYYPAAIEEIKDLGIVESTYKGETTTKHKEQYIFGVETGNGSKVQVSKRVNVSADPRSTGWAIYKAITGVESNDFDSDELLNKPCQVLIEVRTDPNGSGEWENIVTVLPPK